MTLPFARLIAASVLSTCAAFAQADTDYILNTASTGGTYHPVGTAIATLSKIKLLPSQKFSLTAVNSAGSAANVQAMAAGTAQFAILQGLYGSYAASGTGPISERQTNLRAVSVLWQNVEQFILNKDHVRSGDLSDLLSIKGQAAAMGKQNSGTLGSNAVLLSGLGLNIEQDYRLIYAGYGPSADALANGQALAAGIPSGVPTSAITQLMSTNTGKFQLLSVTDEQHKAMDAGRELWVRYQIPANSYPGQSEAVNTVAQPNFLAVNASVDDEHVYQLTRSIYENLPFLQGIHPATKAMSLQTALAGLPVPLHPGAARYFKEAGLRIPERLLSE